MYQFLVIANTRTNIVFQTGSKNCQPHYSKKRNYDIAARYDTNQSENYAAWATKLVGIDYFEYQFFYADTAQEARDLAKAWISENDWSIHPSKSRPSKVK